MDHRLDHEERRHRERMELERRRDRVTSMRNRGFSEDEIESFERRRSVWRFIFSKNGLGALFILTMFLVAFFDASLSKNGTTKPAQADSISGKRGLADAKNADDQIFDNPSADRVSPTKVEDESIATARPFSGPDRDKVRRSIFKALDSGEATIWKSDGLKGYVLVSNEQDYGDSSCRQVSFTRFDGNEQTSTSPELWCQRNGTWSVSEPLE